MADILQPWITRFDLAGCTGLEGADDLDITNAILLASTRAREVSAGQVGLVTHGPEVYCPSLCRCNLPLGSGYAGTSYAGSFPAIYPLDGWVCECLPGKRIDLGRDPVYSIEQILDANGTVIDLGVIQIIDSRWLIRTDGVAWPSCPSTITVSDTTGTLPDIFDKDAVAALACELLKKIRGQACLLPDGVEQYTTGNGTRVRLIDPLDKNLRGLPPVPRFYQWALSKFANTPGGMLDPADHQGSYAVTFQGTSTP